MSRMCHQQVVGGIRMVIEPLCRVSRVIWTLLADVEEQYWKLIAGITVNMVNTILFNVTHIVNTEDVTEVRCNKHDNDNKYLPMFDYIPRSSIHLFPYNIQTMTIYPQNCQILKTIHSRTSHMIMGANFRKMRHN